MLVLRANFTRRWPRLLVLQSVCLALVMVSGCLRKPQSSHPSSIPDSLTLTGTVTTADKQLAVNAPVYVGANSTAIATTGVDGRYLVRLDAKSLAVLSGELSSQSIRLYAASAEDAGLQAASSPVQLASRGSLDLGTMVLGQTASVHGQVLQMQNGQQQSQPAAGVRVVAGHSVTTTGPDGVFTLKGVVAGNVTVMAGSSTSNAAKQAVTLAAGESKQLKRPLVIFPLGGLSGLVVADTDVSVNDLVRQGRPFTRTFGVIGDIDTSYIRYSADATQLTGDGKGPAQWQKLTDSFDFDFQKTGTSTLYYQFADFNQKAFSNVRSLAVTLDNFGATTGMVLGDGSGLLTSNIAPVTVEIPPAAVRMRVAPNIEALQNTPWQQPSPSFAFPFPLTRDPTTNMLQAFGTVTLYLQYLDASGMVSPMYSAAAVLNMFPPVTSGAIFTVNNGAAVSPTRLVQLNINVPGNAHEMLIFEADTPASATILAGTPVAPTSPQTRNIWLAAQSLSFYTFTSTGSKTLYLQFRTIDQAVSPVYKYPIIVQPFADPALGGFLINGGDALTLSPHLLISLKIPPTATQFRIIDEPQMAQLNAAGFDLAASAAYSIGTAAIVPWLEPTPSFIYTPRTARGLTKLYVQFKNVDHDVSPVYQQTIVIDPSPPGTGYLAINPEPLSGTSALVTTTSMVALRVVPPPGYLGAAMIIYEDRLPEPLAFANIIPVPQPDPVTGEYPLIPYALRGLGAHNVYVRFMSVDQNNVPMIATLSDVALTRTIFLEPFPLDSASLVVGDGTGSVVAVDAATVKLTLTAPANVTKMRLVNDDPAQLAQTLMQPFSATINNYALPIIPGQHVVYVQFENADGNISPVYSTIVTVTP